MADPKLRALVQRLHKRTLEKTIGWEKTVDEGVFQVSFKDYSVRLSERPSKDPRLEGLPNVTDLVLQIYNEEGALVEEVSDLEFEEAELGMPAYNFMNQIYTQARRTAMGVERAVDSILEALG